MNKLTTTKLPPTEVEVYPEPGQIWKHGSTSGYFILAVQRGAFGFAEADGAPDHFALVNLRTGETYRDLCVAIHDVFGTNRKAFDLIDESSVTLTPL